MNGLYGCIALGIIAIIFHFINAYIDYPDNIDDIGYIFWTMLLVITCVVILLSL